MFILSPQSKVKRLSLREHDVVRLLCCGLSNKEIAAALNISPRTVKNHMTNICDKWKLRSRTQIVIRAFGTGLHDARQCWVDMQKM